MLFDLPDEILTQSDLKKVASIMKLQNVEIGIMGFVMKNGVPREKKYGIARVNAAGDRSPRTTCAATSRMCRWRFTSVAII